jgi:hypothetical protein
MKEFFVKAWDGIKWVWAKIVVFATFIKDFSVWLVQYFKRKGKSE